jgi:hypothetical protein
MMLPGLRSLDAGFDGLLGASGIDDGRVVFVNRERRATRPEPYGFSNLAHVAPDALGHRLVEAHASRQESNNRKAGHLRRLGCRIFLRVPRFPKMPDFSGPS